ncbi:RagB/SusD family nutrient uptake outer membrane protein [Flavobacteriaceae bacterium F89]|uniref:RagB/SusD family nutrient uptake outer membrane protein n=1 Tax=Cerina litoralis TaxID=2874477 RepID=A0AAE3EXE1_9FLAO|nr:RagB/SusD family nutrient uptake outer membrane protein [Cerina litoralis]MCG2462079.1 RagB/SusD family nutrient uptake outer membrane protein [Cerina litoralis]
MKHYNRKRALLIGIFSFMSFLGCKDDLEEETFSFISSKDYYKNASDAEGSINGIYGSLDDLGLYGRWYFDLLLLTDDQVTIHRNPLFIQMDDFNYDSDHPYITDLWSASYATIKYANVSIDRIPAIDMDAGMKNSLIAEARCIRALMYFNLVRLWGEVPLVLNEVLDENSVANPKGSIGAIYETIIADLSFASENLPLSRPSEDFGRMTKGISKTILTDVQLTLGNWQEAAALAKEIIDSGQYSLQTNFQDIFTESNELNNEIILSIIFDGVTVGNWAASFSHAGGTDNALCFNGAQVWQVDVKSDMWLNWDENDLRKQFSLYEDYLSIDGTFKSVYDTSRPYPGFGKWNAPNETGVGNCPINPILYRYADVLLMYAEASSQANGGPDNEALNAVNMVRRRGYGLSINEISSVDLPQGMDAVSFREAILNERSHEFVVEAKRLFDLMRTDQFPQKLIELGKNIRPSAKLFPIPNAELEANESLSPSDQNEGY